MKTLTRLKVLYNGSMARILMAAQSKLAWPSSDHFPKPGVVDAAVVGEDLVGAEEGDSETGAGIAEMVEASAGGSGGVEMGIREEEDLVDAEMSEAGMDLGGMETGGEAAQDLEGTEVEVDLEADEDIVEMDLVAEREIVEVDLQKEKGIVGVDLEAEVAIGEVDFEEGTEIVEIEEEKGVALVEIEEGVGMRDKKMALKEEEEEIILTKTKKTLALTMIDVDLAEDAEKEEVRCMAVVAGETDTALTRQ